MSGQFGFQVTDPLPPLPLNVRTRIEMDNEFDLETFREGPIVLGRAAARRVRDILRRATEDRGEGRG